MQILLYILMVLVVISIRPVPLRDNSLDVNRLLPIRGLFSIMIILHHITQRISGDALFFGISITEIGFLAVSVFFSISGYALHSQICREGKSYLRNFWKKRFISMLLPYLLLNLLFLCFYGMDAANSGRSVSSEITGRIIDQFREAQTIVPFSWYIEIILILYLFFFLSALVFFRNRFLYYSFLLMELFLFQQFLRFAGYPYWWYKTLFAFPLGMLYYDAAHMLRSSEVFGWLLGKRIVYALLTVLSAVSFAFLWPVYLQDKNNLLLTQLAAGLFALMVLFLMQCIQLKSIFFSFAGKRSYELYLTQGIPITLALSEVVSISFDTVYIVFVLLGTFLCAEILYRIALLLQKK